MGHCSSQCIGGVIAAVTILPLYDMIYFLIMMMAGVACLLTRRRRSLQPQSSNLNWRDYREESWASNVT